MSTDFRDGRTYPRPGRTIIDGYVWLARASDKARAAGLGKLHDYLYPCPLDLGVMKRWDITPSEFDRAIQEYPDDLELAAWLSGRVNSTAKIIANHWVLYDKAAYLDRQEFEERICVSLTVV